MAARRPRLRSKLSTSAPWLRATAAVSSVDPSSTTSTSTPGTCSAMSWKTLGRFSASFQAGMKMMVSRPSAAAGLPFASGEVIEYLALPRHRRCAPDQQQRLGVGLVSHLDLGAGRHADEAERIDAEQLGRVPEREGDRPLQHDEPLLLGALAMPPSSGSRRVAPHRRTGGVESERLGQAGRQTRSVLLTVRALREGELGEAGNVVGHRRIVTGGGW